MSTSEPASVRRQDPLAEPLESSVLRGQPATRLQKAFGFTTVGELMRHYPRNYQHWGTLTPIADLELDEYVTILAEITSVSTRQMANRRGSMMHVKVTDGSSSLDLAFFNAQRLKHLIQPGRRLLFSGKVTLYRGKRQLAHPTPVPFETEAEALAQLDRPLPIYPATGTLNTLQIRKAMHTVLDVLGDVPDPIPPDVLARRGLIPLTDALHQVHRPLDDAAWRQAHARLKFEEAFVLQVALARRRARDRAGTATARVVRPGGLVEAFDARLPFTLTEGQVEVSREIAEDLAQAHPMHRLLQGEVGSGKTVVALRAMLTVVDAGGQAALLAPTEVLAGQHYRSITAMLGPLAQRGMLGGDDRGTQVVLLTGSIPARSRRRVLIDAFTGDAGIVVGTHALLEDRVGFFDLGLVVVDEQHRFGVEQRAALTAKGVTPPHVLVMTATPIPRTVAMTVFGDLDVSTLTELPVGRSPITTHVVQAFKPGWLDRAWQVVREQVAAGHQAFVVCPRIGATESDEMEVLADSADDEAEDRRPPLAVLDVAPQLAAGALAGLRLEVLHGRLAPEAKDDVMRRFTAGEIDVLIATTVVEVGVDVPNATVMVVLDADRFGVSQLHQLRGRIGRGSASGLCFLVTDVPDGAPPTERLRAVAATTDGFELSRIDLESRREGDVLGASQSGKRSSLRLLSVLRDEDVIVDARGEASALVEDDPTLERHPVLRAALDAALDPDRADYLEKA